MNKEHPLCQMVEDIKEIIKIIKRMDLIFLNGLMPKNIKDICKMKNKIPKANFVMIIQNFGGNIWFKIEEELNEFINKKYY